LRDIVDRTFISMGAEIRTKYEVRFSTTAIAMVAEGLGLAVLPENSRQLATNVDVAAVELIEPAISREISLLQRRQRMLSPAAAQMRDFLIETANPLAMNGRTRRRSTRV